MARTTTSTPQDNSGERRSGARPRLPSPGGPTSQAPNILTFFKESRAELRKVTWPTRQETMNLTTAVIGMTVGVAIFLGLIDAGLDKIVSLLLGNG